ncbi:hypothetical protein TNCV_5051531 [Trichonephila clavipes]|nr:hypothetical protein TNCV_5051531 [Trichonephila clavipes]
MDKSISKQHISRILAQPLYRGLSYIQNSKVAMVTSSFGQEFEAEVVSIWSWAQDLIQLKIRYVKGLIRVKSVLRLKILTLVRKLGERDDSNQLQDFSQHSSSEKPRTRPKLNES